MRRKFRRKQFTKHSMCKTPYTIPKKFNEPILRKFGYKRTERPDL